MKKIGSIYFVTMSQTGLNEWINKTKKLSDIDKIVMETMDDARQ